ncbi:MAG: extracellular solute-binding protein, partial [Spirochaetales bacterium]|nr:extracellular solute-binding protein [Spirochaetales bacterium]
DGGLKEIQNLPSTLQFNTDNALKVAKVIDELRANEMYPGDTVSNGGWGPAFALYNEEKAAMIYTYPWMLGSMSQGVQDKSKVIDVPQIAGSDVDSSTFISGFATFGFAVNDKSWNNASKKPGLKKFIDFMVSDEMFNELMKGGLIPTKAYDMPFDAFNDVMQQTLKHYQGRAQTTSHFWNIDEPANATALKGGLDELYAGIIGPDEFVKKVQQSFDNNK